MRSLFLLLFIFICSSINVVPAFAGWQAIVTQEATALPMLVAVDKSRQAALFYGRQASDLETSKVPCSSGQVVGDKQEEGDKKTPEGVYFVERRRTDGLDYSLYGNEAYTLNYPNPVDRLRKKNGHGIWIHGRGTPIVPRETKGCIALNNVDIASLESKVIFNTPVILAEAIAPFFVAGNENEVLKEKTQQWLAAWQNRSVEYLDFFDATAFSKSMNQSFFRFAQKKKRLFSILPYIITWTDNIQVLQGPGYWVTWFKQYYRAKNLTVQGVRRLYWQKNDAGKFVIVGMEWQEKELDAEKAYLDAMSPSVHKFLDVWVTDWKNAALQEYIAKYSSDAVQGGLYGAKAIETQKSRLWKSKKPQQIKLSDVSMRVTHRGLEVSMIQYYGDSTGYSDRGRKTLVLWPKGDNWTIAREEWRSL